MLCVRGNETTHRVRRKRVPERDRVCVHVIFPSQNPFRHLLLIGTLRNGRAGIYQIFYLLKWHNSILLDEKVLTLVRVPNVANWKQFSRSNLPIQLCVDERELCNFNLKFGFSLCSIFFCFFFRVETSEQWWVFYFMLFSSEFFFLGNFSRKFKKKNQSQKRGRRRMKREF